MEPRPKVTDPRVLDLFYRRMAETLLESSCDMVEGMSLDEVERGLRYAGPPAMDGYEYAKQLEANGWSGITASDVDVLDAAYGIRYRAHEEVLRSWVTENGLEPPFPSGAKVRTTITKFNPSMRRGVEEVCVGHAYYDDRLRQLGQCMFRDARWVEEHGTDGGYVLDWERCEAL